MSKAAGRRLIAQLKPLPYFPNLRFIPGDAEVAHNVAWGEEIPDYVEFIDRGIWFGYSATVVEAFRRRQFA